MSVSAFDPHDDPNEQRVLNDIEEYGWHCVWVEADDFGLGFNYSIGFTATYGHPEMIMFGLDSRLMHDVMWNLARDVKNGRRFDQDGLYEGLIERYACATRHVHPSQHPDHLGYAMWHRRHSGQVRDLVAVQVFWPDRAGLFPWERGCQSGVAHRQPLLYLPKQTTSSS